MTHRLLLLSIMICLGGSVRAGEETFRFPPPEFSSGYELPSPRQPVPAYADHHGIAAVILGLAILASALLAIRFRSRRALLVLTVGCLLYFGFWRKGCVCPVGATQNMCLSLGDSAYAIPLGLAAIFLLPLGFALFSGRSFCAAVCPLGAVQELTLVRPVRVPLLVEHILGCIPFLYLGFALLLAWTGSAFLICRYDPIVSVFRLGGRAPLLWLTAGILLAGLFVGRPYCRFLCPYGALLRLLSPLSRWHARITPGECIQCRLCEDACPYNAITAPEPVPGESELRHGRRRLAGALIALPLLVVAGAGLGHALSEPLSRLHPAVAAADRIHAESTGAAQGTTPVSDAVRHSGIPHERLYAIATRIRERFALATPVLLGIMGALAGLKLVYLTRPRIHPDYRPDPARCVSCGRCFRACPVPADMDLLRESSS